MKRARKLQEVKWQPGRWIDCSGDQPVVRDATGKIVARDLYIARSDIEVIVRRLAENLDLSEAEIDGAIRKVKSLLEAGGQP